MGNKKGSPGHIFLFVFLLFLSGRIAPCSQDSQFRGQLSGWVWGNFESPVISQVGFRYIPELSIKKSIRDGLFMDLELSLDTFAAGNFVNGNNLDLTGKIKPYRLWGRLSGNHFEARIGLQKINFGSATLFRPLRWFDRIDPRDPLQLTEGVNGLLLRYYFNNNANIWFWALYGNDEIKGWETAPTPDNEIEFGGRLQLPVSTGETGFTFHHRRADLSGTPAPATLSSPNRVSENRFAFDCKLDITIGLWLELALIQRDTKIPLMKHQRMWTLGADYTFGIGNGLTVLTEFSKTTNADKFLGNGESISLWGVSANYLVGMFDRVSAIYYCDLTNSDNYMSLNWQRTTDNWQFHFTIFLNPDTGILNRNGEERFGFSGKGFRLMVVFNH